MKLGQVKLIGVKGTSDPKKAQLILSEIVVNPTKRPNALSLLNAGDDRFNSQKARMGWITAEKSQILEYFGVDCSDLKKGEEISLDIENPEMGGYPLHLEVVETSDASDYDKEDDVDGEPNIMKTAKQYEDKEGNTQYLLTEDGKPIFSRTSIVLGEAKHSFFGNTKAVSEKEFEAVAAGFVKSQDAIKKTAGA